MITNTVTANHLDRESPSTVTRTVRAHGGKLIHRRVHADEAADLLLRAGTLPRIRLDARTAADADLIAGGALSPLDGFLRKDDYLSVIRDMRLQSGVAFPVPITLSVPTPERARFREGREAALTDVDGQVVGIIAVDELYELDRDLESKEVYRTTDPTHPGVAYLLERRDEIGVGGRITLGRHASAHSFPTLLSTCPIAMRYAGPREAALHAIARQNYDAQKI